MSYNWIKLFDFQFYAAVFGASFAGFVGGHRVRFAVTDKGYIFSGYAFLYEFQRYGLGAALGKVHIVIGGAEGLQNH